MSAKFTKLEDVEAYNDDGTRINTSSHNNNGSNYFYASTEWLDALLILRKNIISPFYVIPPVAHLCLELAVKALAQSYDVNYSTLRQYRNHKITDTLIDYAPQIPEFNLIINNVQQMTVIEEFSESFVETRYANTIVVYDVEEVELLQDITIALRDAYTIRTGLK